jgi:hypothetical protein
VRHRSVSALVAIVVMILGLASRKFGWLLPDFLQKNLGDVLWATMVFFMIALLLPRLSTLQLATAAFAFSCCIEASKLFHAPWFNAIRSTAFGRLIFGYVFGWSNIFCYFVGMALAATIDNTGITKLRRQSRQAE